MHVPSTIAVLTAMVLALPAIGAKQPPRLGADRGAEPVADTLTADPLTGLPLDPATVCNTPVCVQYGTTNTPVKMPDALWCKSKMQSNFYTLHGFNVKVDATVAWYAAHLKGFKRAHAFASGRSNDTFYNATGTLLVLVMGDPGPEGASATAYSVSYYRLQPGLSEKSIMALARQQRSCS